MSEGRSVAAQIRGFIVDESNVSDPEFVQETTDLIDAGILDSLFLVSLVSFCEERFEVDFDFDELSEESFRSVSALTDLVRSKLASGSAPIR